MKERLERLKEVLVIQSESYKQWRMFAFLIRKLEALGVKYFVIDGNIYAQKGEAKVFPCAIAHMDTVHDIVEDLTILEVGHKLTGFNRYTMKQSGIGGDDKVGIYIALECLRHFDNFKVAFYRDEEVGCDGSYDSYMGFFDNVSFVLQADRRGNSDFITRASGTQLSSKQFKKAMSPIIKKYGYSYNDGMMTDVMALKENGLKVSCANISCGYYEPHMKNEYVDVRDVDQCLHMMIEIFTKYGSTKFHHTIERIGRYGGGWSKHSKWNNLHNRWDSEGDTYDYRRDFSTIDENGAGKKRYVDMNDKEKDEFWKNINTGKTKLEDTDYSVELNNWRSLSEKERQELWDKMGAEDTAVSFRPAEDDEGEDFVGDGTDHKEPKSKDYVKMGVFGYCDNCNREKLVLYEKVIGGYLCQECRPLYIDR